MVRLTLAETGEENDGCFWGRNLKTPGFVPKATANFTFSF